MFCVILTDFQAHRDAFIQTKAFRLPKFNPSMTLGTQITTNAYKREF